MVNGFAIFYNLSADMNVGIISIGTVMVQKGSNPNILHSDGKVVIEDFDNKIYIDDTVTVDMLREKEMKFISANKIICRKELWGCIQSHAHIGNKMEESKENPENKKKR